MSGPKPLPLSAKEPQQRGDSVGTAWGQRGTLLLPALLPAALSCPQAEVLRAPAQAFVLQDPGFAPQSLFPCSEHPPCWGCDIAAGPRVVQGLVLRGLPAATPGSRISTDLAGVTEGCRDLPSVTC